MSQTTQKTDKAIILEEFSILKSKMQKTETYKKIHDKHGFPLASIRRVINLHLKDVENNPQ